MYDDSCNLTYDQLLNPMDPANNDVPQLICNHRCRDGIRCDGERIACIRQRKVDI